MTSFNKLMQEALEELCKLSARRLDERDDEFVQRIQAGEVEAIYIHNLAYIETELPYSLYITAHGSLLLTQETEGFWFEGSPTPLQLLVFSNASGRHYTEFSKRDMRHPIPEDQSRFA